MRVEIASKTLPGNKSKKILQKLRKLNGAWNYPYPFVLSHEGDRCHFKDIDGNIFLDFASQISSNPFGYNDKDINQVLRRYKKSPVKYAGQDFVVKEHLTLIEELLKTTKKNLNSAFLVNSGAEAVENAIKIAMRMRKKAKFGISFENSFHGRTIGALSLTNSKVIHKKNFFSIPMRRLPYNESAIIKLENLIKREISSEEIAFIIMEPVQGEGGYNFPSKKMVNDIANFCRVQGIPFIADEVQTGMGRTGKFWCMEHYNVVPNIMSSAKALQAGAVISNRKNFPEPGSISSTWGGGDTINLAIGIEIIKKIRKSNLLNHVNHIGEYLMKRLKELNLEKVRGKGLMIAFDMPNKKIQKDFIVECAKNGLVLLGCGEKSIRVIPPYVVSRKDVGEAIEIIEKSFKNIRKRGFKHSGYVCNFMECGEGYT